MLKALNRLEMLAKAVAEGTEKYRKETEAKEIHEHLNNNKRKDAIGEEILELKSTISILENRYRSLMKIKEESTVSVTIEGIHIPLSVKQVVSIVRKDLDSAKSKNERLSKEFYRLCKQIESHEKKHNLGEKVDLISKTKERTLIDRSDFMGRLFPELLAFADVTDEGETYEDGLLNLERLSNGVTCSFDGLLFVADTQKDTFEVSSSDEFGNVILFANGESTNIRELFWFVEMDELLLRNIEVAYKALLYTLTEIEDKTQKTKLVI